LKRRKLLKPRRFLKKKRLLRLRKILEEKKAAEEKKRKEEEDRKREEEEAKRKPVDSSKAVDYLLNASKEIDEKFESFISDAPDHIYEDFIKNDPSLLQKYQKEKEKRKNDKDFTMKKFVSTNDELKSIFVNKLKKNPKIARTFIESDSSVRDQLENEQRKKDQELLKFIAKDPHMARLFKEKLNEGSDNEDIEDFIKEQLKDSKQRERYTKFKISQLEDKEYEDFIESQPELKKLYEKKKAAGEIDNAKELVEGNKTLLKRFREYREENADEIREKMFVESNPEMLEQYKRFCQKQPEGKGTTYKDFLQQDRKAKETFLRDVLLNEDNELNFLKFLAQSQDARDAMELAGDDANIRDVIKKDKDLSKAYKQFLEDQQAEVHFNNFLSKDEDLNRKYQEEIKKNPKIDKKEFLKKNGKQDDLEKFTENENKKTEMFQFIQSNDELREKFAALQRQSSKADIEDFIDKNKEVKKHFENFTKEKEEEKDANSFIQDRPDLQKKFDEARKKDPSLTVKDFVDSADQSITKDFERHKEERQSEKEKENREKNKKRKFNEFLETNPELAKEFKAAQNKDSDLDIETFLNSKAKKQGSVKRDLDTFLIQKEDDKDYEHFINEHPELKKIYEKKKAQGDVVDAKDFVTNNKALNRKFDEYKGDNADEIRARKFVETNPELQAQYQEFLKKNPEGKDSSYLNFIEKDKKASRQFAQEVLHNKDHELNVQKFLATNQELKDALELAGKGADVRQIIENDKDLKAAYDAFMQQQTQDAHLNKFIHSQDDLRKKFEAESQKNPQLNLRDFVAKHGKTDDFDRFQESEQRKIDMHQFVQRNDELREKFAQLQRQSSKADIEEFVEKNKDVKRGFDEHKKQQQDESDAREFVESRADLQKKFEDAKKKNPGVTVTEFVGQLQKTDSKVGKEFERHRDERQSERERESKEKERQRQLGEFVRGNSELEKEWRERQRQDPRMSVEEFVKEKSKTSGEVKRGLEQFMLERQDEADYEEFVRMHPELQRMLEKKMAEGEVRDARELVQGNKQLKKKFEEHRAEHAEEIRARKFVESHFDVMKQYSDYISKNPNKEKEGYKAFIENNRGVKEKYGATVIHNKDNILNLEAFLAKNKDARDAVELAGKGADIAKIIAGDKDLKAAYDAFMQQQTQDAHLNKFIHSQDDLRKKFEAESQKNPQLNLRDFVAKHGKTDDFDRFQESEQRKIDMHQFVQGNDELREKFAQLQRQSSKADIEEFVEKNKDVKRGFDEHKKQQQDESDAREFVESRADLQKKFEDAKKKNPGVTVTEFVGQLQKTDSKVGKEFERHRDERQSERERESKEKERQRQLGEFVRGNSELEKEWRERQRQDPRMSVEEFVKEKSKTSGEVKRGLEQFMLERQDEADYEEFVRMHPELQRMLEKKMAEGEVRDARELVQGNKQLKKKFEEHRAEHAEEIRARKFVESNPEMEKRWREFQGKYPEVKDITYREFLENDRKAREVYEREVVHNKESKLNLDTFLAKNKDARDAVELAGKGADIAKIIAGDKDLKAAYDEFLNNQREEALLDKFINNNEELRKKYQQEIKKNPGLDKKTFVKSNGKTDDFDRFQESEQRKIDMHQFVQGNDELREKFAQLQRQSSKADIEEFVEKNKDVKRGFDEHKKQQQDESDAREFVESRADLQKKFEDAKKKNPGVTVTEFVGQLQKTDSKVGKEFERHRDERQSERERESKEKERQRQLGEFVRGNSELEKEWRERQRQDPRMSVEEFVKEKSKTSGEVKRGLEQFMLERQDEADYEEFVRMHPSCRGCWRRRWLREKCEMRGSWCRGTSS
jgi:hypothetical protein